MRRQSPWIHRFSRPLIGALAALGIADTGYLTSIKLSGGGIACSSESCNAVLSSPYANVFGLPLSLFGLLAYGAVAVMAIAPLLINTQSQKKLHGQAQALTWLGLLIVSAGMMVFSGYLMYLLFGVINAPCPYCIASAVFATGIFILTLMGREWDDLGAVLMPVLITGFLTLLVTVGIFSSVAPVVEPTVVEEPTTTAITSLRPNANQQPPWKVSSQSGSSELALTQHLKTIGAKMYGAAWCPHCYEQKQLLGREAVKASLDYIECDPDSPKSQTTVCTAASIKSFPTWEIKGQRHLGILVPEKLAELSGYTGPKDFRYSKLMGK
jgi:uncharacterized membrane protein/glutaredoxin